MRVRHASALGLGPTQQSGVAVLTALLVISLAASVVAGLFWREHVAARSVENRLALAQTRWVERAALDWARVILQADLRAGRVDHLSEPWAVPVMDTRIDETVAAGARLDDRVGDAVLAGQITDAQARLNLNDLVSAAGLVSVPHQTALRRLVQTLGWPEAMADAVIGRVAQSRPRDGQTLPPERPPLLRVADLRDTPGIEAGFVSALQPFVILLPRSTALNVNTAPAELLSAMVPALDLASARRFVAQRERTFFRSLAEASQAMPGAPALDSRWLAVESSYFLVSGVIRLGRVESHSETLLERSMDRVVVVWQVRR
jgi:general secretion pathway protein K